MAKSSRPGRRRPEAEDESLAAIKDWWDEYGRYLVAGVVVGLGIVASWFVWDYNREQRLMEASDRYADMFAFDEEATGEEAEENFGELGKIFQDIQTNYRDTPYAILSALTITRFYVMRNDLDAAAASLEAAMQNAREQDIAFLEGLALTRLARVLVAQGKTERALEMLSAVELPAGMMALSKGIHGDILAAQNRKQEAAEAYGDSLQTLGDADGFLNMKLQELGVQAP